MFRFFTGNIFILIPIALFIFFRVLEARRKQQNPSQKQDEKGAGGFLSLFEAEEDEAEPEARESTYPLLHPNPQAKGVKVAPKRPIIPKAEKLSLPSIEPGVRAPEKILPRPVQPPLGDFAARLDSLPSLQRAVVMSEILGSPKGLG